MLQYDSEQADRLMKARCRLMTREPWYGHIAMDMAWIQNEMPWKPEQQRTMGVCITSSGEVQCLYYTPFVKSITIKELYAIVQHEIEHIVRVHCVRTDDREPDTWNIACDMTVNGLQSSPRIGYRDPVVSELIIPMKDRLVWIPTDWPDDGTAEQYYEQLKKFHICHLCNLCGRENVVGQHRCKDGDDVCPACGCRHDNIYRLGNKTWRGLDDHTVWKRSDISKDEARQIIKDMVDQATERCHGYYPGHLESTIAALAKPVVRWRELLRHYFGKHIGNQRYTYSRRNRRHDSFGIPGISHCAAASVNVIVDTSGSIQKQEFEQFFAEIDVISSRTKTMVLQWDTQFQGYQKYRRGDWKKLKISGHGGTDMVKPIEWLIDNRMVADVQIMLTDGHCVYIDKENIGFPMITVITANYNNRPKYGHSVIMNVL